LNRESQDVQDLDDNNPDFDDRVPADF